MPLLLVPLPLLQLQYDTPHTHQQHDARQHGTLVEMSRVELNLAGRGQPLGQARARPPPDCQTTPAHF